MSETPRRPDETREDGPASVEREAPGFTDATRGHGPVPDRELAAREPALPEEGELEPDVEQIHRPIFREPADPEEGREPAPWWLWTIAALALFWGGWYLGYHGGTFGEETHVAFGGATEFVREEAVDQAEDALTDPVATGERIYARQCQSCHQPSGLGVPGAFPPVVGSEWVTGSPETLARILLNGLQGPITVAGESYNGQMPAWRDVLSDGEIAAVGSYIRQWGTNDAPPLDAELVARLRAATADRGAVPPTADEFQQVEELAPMQERRP